MPISRELYQRLDAEGFLDGNGPLWGVAVSTFRIELSKALGEFSESLLGRRYTCKSMRHYRCREFKRAGVDRGLAQEIMGHDAEMFDTVYGAPSESDLQGALAKVRARQLAAAGDNVVAFPGGDT